MSVLHRFSLGYSKTVGEIQRADVSLYLSSLTVNIQKDGGKKGILCWLVLRYEEDTSQEHSCFFSHFHLAVFRQ